jgi:hypothetical protein
MVTIRLTGHPSHSRSMRELAIPAGAPKAGENPPDHCLADLRSDQELCGVIRA